MKLNTLVPIIFLALRLTTTVVAQKKIETSYFNANDDSVKTKAEASYYRVVQTNGRHRLATKYDSLDMKLEETSFRKDKPRTGVGDSVWWKYGSHREWYPSGQLKTEISYLYDRFHDNLKTYYPNGALRRNDVYYIDTLRQGHCYAQDSSELAYFPYQVNPEFKGGQREMFQYLGKNTIYPKESRENGIEGTVYVGFVVNKDGDIAEVKIKKGVSKLLDKEALRVVKAMPRWTAGKLEGELVRVHYTLPISFKMQ
jgi:TonB family protein